MQHTTIAVDLAKSVFEVAVSQRPGTVAERRRLSRAQFARLLGEREPTTFVMEACGTAHFWAREAQARGHRVVLLPPHAVRPYVLRNKTDGADAEALLEAMRNEAIRPVPVKSVDQHVLGALHRLRSTWIATRTGALEHVARAAAGARLRDPGGRAPGRASGSRARGRGRVGRAGWAAARVCGGRARDWNDHTFGMGELVSHAGNIAIRLNHPNLTASIFLGESVLA
jgi:Transposase